MVGHTHEDVDQLFSCVSRKLRKVDAFDMPGLQQVIAESYKPEPLVKIINGLVNYRDWLAVHIDTAFGHSDQHQFKIFLGANGKPLLQYKKWSTSPKWLPEDKPLQVLLSPPTADPFTCQADFSKTNLGKLRNEGQQTEVKISYAEYK